MGELGSNQTGSLWQISVKSVRLARLEHGPFGLAHGLVKRNGEAGCWNGIWIGRDLGPGQGLGVWLVAVTGLGRMDGVWGRLERWVVGTYGRRRVGAKAGQPPTGGDGRNNTCRIGPWRWGPRIEALGGGEASS
jgi:hypothetical protein